MGCPPRLEVEDIYFITKLSHWGEVVNLQYHGLDGGITIEEYIVIYYLLDTEKLEIQVLVNAI